MSESKIIQLKPRDIIRVKPIHGVTGHPQIKRFRSVEIALPKKRHGLSGHFRLEAFQCREMLDGRSVEIPNTRRHLASFDNNITDLGLDHIGNQLSYFTYCHAGTGNAAESPSDTALATFVASQQRDPGWLSTWGARTTAPFYGWNKAKYRFAPNFGGGAISVAELGISTQAATGGLFSRALVKDSQGDPTTVGISATEYFDAFYTLRNYPDHVNYATGALDDGSGTVTIESIDYDYVTRVAEITNYIWWGRNIDSGFGVANYPNATRRATVYGSDATIGSISTNISATSLDNNTVGNETVGTYVNANHYNDITFEWGFSDGNVTGNIKGMWVSSSLGSYQHIFTPVIPKNSGLELNFTQRTSWFRKTI